VGATAAILVVPGVGGKVVAGACELLGRTPVDGVA